MVMCMCLRAWGDADREADEDERQASIVTSADEVSELSFLHTEEKAHDVQPDLHR